jgi:hypothetical protein
VIGASDEQVDVFNEVWYTVLINVRETSKGRPSLLIGLSFNCSDAPYIKANEFPFETQQLRCLVNK